MSIRIHINHPTGREKAADPSVSSKAYATVNRGLKSGKLDQIDLSEKDLIVLLREASNTLAILKDIR